MEYETVWVAYDTKYPYLPVCIARTAGMLAEMVGVKENTIWGSVYKFENGKKNNTRYARVLIEKD